MSINKDIENLEKSWVKPRKKRKPRKNPRKRKAGVRVSVSVEAELVEWLSELVPQGWSKSDVVNAGLVMIYMIENKGEMPESIGVNEYMYRPWEGDRIRDWKARVVKKRRDKHVKKSNKKTLIGGADLPHTYKKKELKSQIKLEADSFDWDAR